MEERIMRNILTTSMLAAAALSLSACGGEAAEGETLADTGGAATADAPAGESVAAASGIDFGDDASRWSNDGECDDPRFQGPGMTATPLLEDDILHDATDCREAFERGELELAAAAK
jgi:hypothetical protein